MPERGFPAWSYPVVFQEEKVSKAYIRLAFPVAFSMAVSLVYNLADTFFVAQTNDTNIVAGVSLSMPLFATVMAVGISSRRAAAR